MTTTLTPAPTLERLPGSNQQDLADIRVLLGEIEAGVTAKDPDRCVSWFAADARSVTAGGVRSIGRDAIRAAHVAAFAGALATTVARFEVLDVLSVRPDVAVVTTGAWSVQPDNPDIDLTNPATVVSYVLVREPDGWWVALRQFTRVAGAS